MKEYNIVVLETAKIGDREISWENFSESIDRALAHYESLREDDKRAHFILQEYEDGDYTAEYIIDAMTDQYDEFPSDYSGVRDYVIEYERELYKKKRDKKLREIQEVEDKTMKPIYEYWEDALKNREFPNYRPDVDFLMDKKGFVLRKGDPYVDFKTYERYGIGQSVESYVIPIHIVYKDKEYTYEYVFPLVELFGIPGERRDLIDMYIIDYKGNRVPFSTGFSILQIMEETGDYDVTPIDAMIIKNIPDQFRAVSKEYMLRSMEGKYGLPGFTRKQKPEGEGLVWTNKTFDFSDWLNYKRGRPLHHLYIPKMKIHQIGKYWYPFEPTKKMREAGITKDLQLGKTKNEALKALVLKLWNHKFSIDD